NPAFPLPNRGNPPSIARNQSATMKSTFSLIVLACLAVGSAPAAQPKPLRVLLITGGCCHEYAKQKDVLKLGLEARANVEITQVHTNDTSTRARFPMYESADWAKAYDAVIHDECSSDVTNAPYVRNILAAHSSGVAAVNLHCAMHCYRTG